MNLKNILLALKDQLPLKRLFITRNGLGLFHINSHIAVYLGKPKVMYNTRQSALKAAESMSKKKSVRFSCYKCAW